MVILAVLVHVVSVVIVDPLEILEMLVPRVLPATLEPLDNKVPMEEG